LLLRASLSIFAVGAILAACGSSDDSKFPDPNANGDDSGGGSSGILPGGDGGASSDAKPCTNLCLKQVQCTGGGTTSISGVIKDPAGKVPLYNILVYVPNAPVAPIVTGASCERCGNVSGEPLVSAITDAAGKFKLDNVPVGKDIPLVIQVGKWRRQITVPAVAECADTPLDATLSRLPRNKAEGDLPQMALSSGNADPFECLLTKMGIDLAEFTPDTGAGRVHFFHENGVDMSPPTPASSTLYSDATKLKKYDIVFLPCEGSPRDKPADADQNLVDYTAIGGRVFTTHYSYVWLDLGAAPFPATGVWGPEQPDKYSSTVPQMATINQAFPKGAAFAQWLVNVNASTTLGQLGLLEARHDLNSAPDPPSTTWMTVSDMPTVDPKATMHITFNTPTDVPEPMQCGRVVYSDFHVSASAKTPGNNPFPQSCKDGDLSAQEKALEFMLFDLSSCIQSDKAPPTPPAVVK
jgi:hypothetical protein